MIIGMSQVRYIVGYRVPRQDSFHEQISVLIQGRAGFKWQVRLRLAVCVKGSWLRFQRVGSAIVWVCGPRE
jgi:hypothetical protein